MNKKITSHLSRCSLCPFNYNWFSGSANSSHRKFILPNSKNVLIVLLGVRDKDSSVCVIWVIVDNRINNMYIEIIICFVSCFLFLDMCGGIWDRQTEVSTHKYYHFRYDALWCLLGSKLSSSTAKSLFGLPKIQHQSSWHLAYVLAILSTLGLLWC